MQVLRKVWHVDVWIRLTSNRTLLIKARRRPATESYHVVASKLAGNIVRCIFFMSEGNLPNGPGEALKGAPYGDGTIRPSSKRSPASPSSASSTIRRSPIRSRAKATEMGIAGRLKMAERRMATPQIVGRDEPLGRSARQEVTHRGLRTRDRDAGRLSLRDF
jgi:hypothetical protein